MSRAGWGATLLGAGIALTLLLVASPALASGMRRPNLRGRPVPVVAGVLPAVAVLLVAGIWAIQEPAGPTLGAALVAAGFGFTGLLADFSGGRVLDPRGVDVPGLVLVAEVGLALIGGALVAPGRAGGLSAAVLIGAAVVLLASPWPPGLACVAAVVGFLPLALGHGGRLLETLGPAVGAGAVLAPLDVNGRLRAGRAASGTLGASAGMVIATRTVVAGRLLVALALALAAATLRLWHRRTYPRVPEERMVR